MKNRSVKISITLSACAILALVLTSMVYEREASKNAAVIISKRIIAEAGALISKNVFKGEKVNDFSFGTKGSGINLSGISGAIDIVNVKDYDVSEYARGFDYEDLSDPRLKALREGYGLEGVVLGGKREFDKIVILRNWVKRNIPRGKPSKVDYNFNAFDILKRAGNGDTFFCSEYSTVFVQCALSLGIQARYIGLLKGHVVAEVWSDDFAKWVVMDVDNDMHYMRGDIPVNALELHDAFENNDISGIRIAKGPAGRDVSGDDKKELISFYHEFYVRMRNDWFSHKYPHWHHKGNSIMNGIEWHDAFTSDSITISRCTNRAEELYFPLNIISLDISGFKGRSGNRSIALNTFTPNFSHFLIEFDEDRPVVFMGGSYEWGLHKGLNSMRVKAVNMLGIEGPESLIKLMVE